MSPNNAELGDGNEDDGVGRPADGREEAGAASESGVDGASVSQLLVPKREIWVPLGVLDTEKPRLEIALKEDEDKIYDGVRIPFNLAAFLNTANGLAQNQGVNFNVMGAAISRMMKKYGPERTERILRGDRDSEESQYLETLIQLEEIRRCVVEAIVDVLNLDAYGDMFMSVAEMRDNQQVRTDILHIMALMRDRMNRNDLIKFFSHDRKDISLRGALRKALPASALYRHPPRRDQMRSDEELEPDFRYLTSEIGLVSEVVGRGGQYVTYVGSDFSFTDEGDQSITACLREAAIAALTETKFDNLAANWETKAALDGFAFYTNGGGGNNPKACDPYYLTRDQLIGAKKEGPVPLRVPLVPWPKGWVSKRMRDDDTGGLRRGQACAVFKQLLQPTLSRYVIHTIDSRGLRSMLAGQLQRDYMIDNLERWAREGSKSSTLIPAKFELKDVNDVVRMVGEDIGRLVNDELRRKKSSSGAHSAAGK